MDGEGEALPVAKMPSRIMIQGLSLLSQVRLAYTGFAFLVILLPGLSGTSRADLVINELMAVADEDRRDEDGAPTQPGG